MIPQIFSDIFEHNIIVTHHKLIEVIYKSRQKNTPEQSYADHVD